MYVGITPQGKAIVAAINRDLIETQKAMLRAIPSSEWAGAFKMLEALAHGARCWQETCRKP